MWEIFITLGKMSFRTLVILNICLSVRTPVIPNMSAKNVCSNIFEHFAGNKIRISLYDFHPGPTQRASKGRRSQPICEFIPILHFCSLFLFFWNSTTMSILTENFLLTATALGWTHLLEQIFFCDPKMQWHGNGTYSLSLLPLSCKCQTQNNLWVKIDYKQSALYQAGA